MPIPDIGTLLVRAAGGGVIVGETLANRYATPVNIKHYGAVGDCNATTGAGTDNTGFIQNAINAAWPISALPGIARPIYLPPGNYRTTSPLYLRATTGSKMYGAGQGTSIITYTGAGNLGNAIGVGGVELTTPVIMTDGTDKCSFSDFSIAGIDANRTSINSTTTGIFTWQSGTYPEISSACSFVNMSAKNFKFAGFVFGTGSNSENMILWNTNIDLCNGYGVYASNANSLNHIVIGGKIQNCGADGTYTLLSGSTTGIRGGLIGNVGTFLNITGVWFENNFIDVAATQSNCNIFGSRTTPGLSGTLQLASIVNGGANIFVDGFTYAGASNKVWLEIFGGGTHVTSSLYEPPSNVGAGKIANNISGSCLIMDNTVLKATGGSSVIYGAGSTSLRNTDFNGSPFPLTSSAHISNLITKPLTISQLPTTNLDDFAGVKVVVTDYQNSGSVLFGDPVVGHAGGTRTVPAVCRGASVGWVIGG